MTDAEELRSLLGESIPAGGSEDDTLFTEAKIASLLLTAGGDLNKAAYAGWREKTAYFAGLVDTAEGSSKRNLGSLYGNAKAERDHFGALVGVITSVIPGRTRIGKIVRS